MNTFEPFLATKVSMLIHDLRDPGDPGGGDKLALFFQTIHSHRRRPFSYVQGRLWAQLKEDSEGTEIKRAVFLRILNPASSIQ